MECPVETSFMMMNQVDSSSFDDDKDDDKKPKEWFQDWVNKFKIKINFKFHEKKSRRFKNQEKFDFKIQEKKSRRLHKGSIEKIFQKPNIARFCFSKEFF